MHVCGISDLQSTNRDINIEDKQVDTMGESKGLDELRDWDD